MHELLVDKQVIDTSISCGIVPRQDVSTYSEDHTEKVRSVAHTTGTNFKPHQYFVFDFHFDRSITSSKWF